MRVGDLLCKKEDDSLRCDLTMKEKATPKRWCCFQMLAFVKKLSLSKFP
jgi:hypothetical protein